MLTSMKTMLVAVLMMVGCGVDPSTLSVTESDTSDMMPAADLAQHPRIEDCTLTPGGKMCRGEDARF